MGAAPARLLLWPAFNPGPAWRRDVAAAVAGVDNRPDHCALARLADAVAEALDVRGVLRSPSGAAPTSDHC